MQPPDLGTGSVSAEAYQLASLKRILTEAAAAASPRKLIGAFVEALGVWANLRVRAYAAGASGGFFHYVSPVGALPSSVPSTLSDEFVPEDGRSARLSRDEADRLGFASEPGDVVVLPLVDASGRRTDQEAGPAWLLIVSGAIDEAEQARLTTYSEMLRESLDEVYEIASNRMIATVLECQPGRDEPARDDPAAGGTIGAAAEAALEQVAAAVGAVQTAMVVTTVTGIRALAVGSTELLPGPDQPPRTDSLVVTSTHTASFMTVVADRKQRPFMAFERAILRAGVSVLHPWIQAALFGADETERRSRFTPLENVFDALAARAVSDGQDTSVIVMSVDPALVSPELLQSWLGTIRVQLRAGDFAGILSDNEIAVLLCDTSADQAAAVSSRLKQIVESDGSAGIVFHPAVGTSTRSPESPSVGSLVGAARAGAAIVR